MKLVIASPGLERATAAKIQQHYPQRKIGRNTFSDFVIPFAGGGGEYNSYFKLILVRSADGATSKIHVVDGATYDAATGNSGKMLCKVNAATFEVAPVVLESPATTKYVYIKYSAAEQTAAATVVVQMEDTPPQDSDSNAYFLVGRVIVSADSISVAQDWTGGVPQIFWFKPCGDS